MAREHSLTTDLVVGVVGALAGMAMADVLGFAFGGFWGGLLISTIGAMLLVFMVGMIRSRRTLRQRPAPDE